MCFILHKRLEPALGAADGSGAGPRSLDKTRESRMSIREFDITGQKVLIVGGGRGIGKGIALAFAEAGADVAVSALTPTGGHKSAGGGRGPGRQALALTRHATKTAGHDPVV